jgi:butyrate kinase
MSDKFILCLNPGSTSTKVAVFENGKLRFDEKFRHAASDLKQYSRIADQYSLRLGVIVDFLYKIKFPVSKFAAIVGIGGLLKPIPCGTYLVNEKMISDLKSGNYGEHASNLGAILAFDLASKESLPAFIVDPVVVDEMEAVARFSGHPTLERKSLFHALNQKAVAKRYAKVKNIAYDKLNLIVVHLGGGISIGAHKNGKVVDVNNALDGEGPFSPERSGGLPAGDLARLCFSGRFTESEIIKMITGQGGLVAYLGTNDGHEVLKRIEQNDQHAALVFKALAYQVAKEIGAMAAVLEGKVDAVILTGGLTAEGRYLVPWITKAVRFIASVVVIPGEDEMLALCEGALRVLNGEELALIYE